MIAGFPISWLLVEIFSITLFFICITHATRQENPQLKILELFGFMFCAALFENVGVNFSHTYYYDPRRIMMIGDVPLEILFIEASTWYAAFTLANKLNVPVWAKPFIVGLFSSIQDMTIDPPAVYDRYAITDLVEAERVNDLYSGAFGKGILSGQWNWSTPGYETGFFGIPFFNFSGWMYMMAYYTALILIGRWLYEKYDKKIIAYSYPFISGILGVVLLASPLNVFLLYGHFDFTQSTYSSELTMLCLNFSFAIALLVAFRKRVLSFDLKEDGVIIFGLPIILHLFDIMYAFILNIEIAYAPVVIVSGIHFTYLYLVYKKNKQLNESVLVHN